MQENDKSDDYMEGFKSGYEKAWTEFTARHSALELAVKNTGGGRPPSEVVKCAEAFTAFLEGKANAAPAGSSA